MPLAACSSRLPLVNMPNVQVCQGFSSCDTRGKSAPFRVGAQNPSPHHYRTAFACSRVFYLHDASPSLTVGLLLHTKRVVQAYHVPQVPPIERVRMPLYTGWVYGCVGSPLILAYLPTMPFWLWGRRVALAPRVSRCVRPRLQLPYPYRSFPEVHRVCHSPSVRLPSA
jgi:hypothetical protein